MDEERARLLLGRIRCLTDAVDSLRKGENVSSPLCFVPKNLTLEVSEVTQPLSIREAPQDDAKVVEKLPEGKSATKVTCKGQPLFNASGGWVEVTSPHQGWLLVESTTKFLGAAIKVVPTSTTGAEDVQWLKVIERVFPLRIGKVEPPSNQDEEETGKMCNVPPGWDFEADKELAHFLVKYGQGKNSEGEDEKVGTCYEHIERINSSSGEDEIEETAIENRFEWISHGSAGTHWLRFHMKPGAIVETFTLQLPKRTTMHRNYPREIEIKAGTVDDLTVLATRTFTAVDYEKRKLPVFPEPLTKFYKVIELHIKSCQRNARNCSITGLSVTTRKQATVFLDSENLNRDIFTPERIARYPKLQPFQSEQLFYRGLLLKRIAHLLNIDLTYLLPRTEQNFSSKMDTVCLIRSLWPLSSKRNALMKELLKATSSKKPTKPTVRINRFSAREHRSKPSKDPAGSNTVFSQMFRELKKRTRDNYTYRWAGDWEQWWECDFFMEGIIDQGGGFRDSLADMADELCPSDPDTEVALPLFIRSPNQSQDSSNVYRDTYIPNPSCTFKDKYYFVGQLMGAMFRSQESLVLSLSQFVWKHLVGEPVSWTRDFVSIDSAEVKFIDSVETMSQEKFDAFQGALKFTTVLSNGESVPLYPGGGEEPVTYENRIKYCSLVKEKRLNENKAQIEAIREGLTSVVPSELLSLVTWQELELKVCGNPDISVEALKKSARYDSSLSENCQAVKIMWEALERFSNDDRSRFLRFITGRRRLPCTIFIDQSDSDNSKLPTSATCSNTLYLPKYTSVEEAVDKLRYAAYNCVAIDTDMTPWD